MNYIRPSKSEKTIKIDRIWVLRVFLIILGSILIARLFYLQIIQHDNYQAKALAEHTKRFQIPAERGLIKMSDGAGYSPVV